MLRSEQNGNIPSLYSLIDSHADFLLTILKSLPFAGHTRAKGHPVDRTHFFSGKLFAFKKRSEQIFVCGVDEVNGCAEIAELTFANIDRKLSDTSCKVHVTKRREKKQISCALLSVSIHSIDGISAAC